ncbi:MAG TPA: lytic transglycosylase domain-containing protein [Candidatus Dormibacteraeota bacterium]|nr:lytic transglycosylase domain-containing protein [Candidatus Dormibacteraeota bacterium]
MSAEVAMAQAQAQLTALSAQTPPTALLDRVRWELAIEAASYAYRDAARQEELRLYEVASYSSVQSSVIPLLPAQVSRPFDDAIAGLHSIYALAGIDQYYLVNVHFTHPYTDAAPVESLRSYYAEAQQLYGVDASYLASINYIESNFGRVNGPSSAGALGPMQFLPGTWANWGNGGNVMDPHAAILAAARYLNHYGAPSNMRQAIFHYNFDYDYVDAVEFFARAYRADPKWLDRMYYWNTTG